jgi:hypothetical protein
MGLLLLLIADGCGGGGASPPPPPPPGGGTGAFGVVTINGLQKLYLPLPDIPTGKTTYQLAVVDVGIAGAGTAGAPARIGYVDLGSATDVATATGGDSTVVIAASTSSNKIWFIDPATDKVTATLTLDASYGTSDFSGGGGYVTGIAMDSRHRAVLSVWNGYIVVDTSAHTIVQSVLVAPSENFGFDATTSRIIAPFYDCGSGSAGTGTPPPCDSYLDAAGVPISEGLNIIDLEDSPPTIYTYQLPTAVSPLESAAPVGGEPDSAAIDTSTGIAVVPSEDGDFANVIDLSHATFDRAAKTATGTASIHHTVDASGRSEGVSIDPVEHIAFFEGEASSDIGVIDLSKASMGMGAYLHADMPDKPSGGSWENMFDPHGIAVTTGILDGHPVGFVVDVSDSPNAWVARIDLHRFLALTPSTPGMATSAEVAPAVTFLDASTAK